MTDPSSRHAHIDRYRRELPGSGEVELLVPRLEREPASGQSHRVKPGERLDHLALRFLGDPYAWWRLADANPGTPLARLDQAGTVLDLPELR